MPRQPWTTRSLLLVTLLTALVLMTAGGPAVAAPASEEARPTADPAAPTPTAPYAGLPPQGTAPGGAIVGGDALATRGVVTAEGAPPLPEGIDARGWLVADIGTGEVLGAQDPHGRYFPASTLKTLTLLTLAPRLDPALVVEGTTEDEAIEGSRVGLVRGGLYPVGLLLDALVMQSGNDAANALARAAGGVDATVAAMNETAQRIGAHDTVAGSPSGLDVAGQSSSPYDLVLIMRQLVADPRTLAVLQTRTAQMPAVPGLTEGYQIQSQNPLLTDYPGTLGGKTGFTDAARHTFVAAAERDGRRLAVSVMQAERGPVPSTEQATRLLDWGFAVPPGADVGRLVDPGEAIPVPLPEARPTGDGVLTSEEAPAEVVTRPAAAGSSARDSRWLPAALAAATLLILTATIIGRRRAVRRPATRSPDPVDDPGTGSAVRRPPSGRPGPSGADGPAAGSPGGAADRPPPP